MFIKPTDTVFSPDEKLVQISPELFRREVRFVELAILIEEARVIPFCEFGMIYFWGEMFLSLENQIILIQKLNWMILYCRNVSVCNDR